MVKDYFRLMPIAMDTYTHYSLQQWKAQVNTMIDRILK